MMRRIVGIALWFGLAAVAAGACSGSEGGADAADVRDATDVAAPDGGVDAAQDVAAGDLEVVEGPDVLAGSFVVSLQEAVPATTTSPAADAYSQVVGVVMDGPSPDLVIWAETLKEGDCRLLVPVVPFCSVSCGGNAACIADEVCQDYPASHSVGTVVIEGIHPSAGASQISMEFAAGGYQTLDPLPYPPFTENEAVTLHAAGADYPAFTIAARGIAPLVLAGGTLALARDQALAVSWTPPGVAGASTIFVKLDISHHGGEKGKIECEVADSGTLSIPAVLVTRLLDLGVAGFPTIKVARRSVGSTHLSVGRVELEVISDLEVPVDVPGVESCNEDSDCKDGKTCQADLTCA